MLWRSEFRNILAGYMRRKRLSFEQAAALQAEAEELLAGCEYEVDSMSVLELVRDSDCSAYDCEFIALAEKLDVKLVTMDIRGSGRVLGINSGELRRAAQQKTRARGQRRQIERLSAGSETATHRS